MFSDVAAQIMSFMVNVFFLFFFFLAFFFQATGQKLR